MSLHIDPTIEEIAQMVAEAQPLGLEVFISTNSLFRLPIPEYQRGAKRVILKALRNPYYKNIPIVPPPTLLDDTISIVFTKQNIVLDGKNFYYYREGA